MLKEKVEEAESLPVLKDKVEEAESLPVLKEKVEEAESLPVLKEKVEEAESLPVLKVKVEEAVHHLKARLSPGAGNILTELLKKQYQGTETGLAGKCHTL